MKKVFLLSIFSILLFSSCSKKSGSGPTNSASANINGATYPTVTIGTQVWTTVDYNGSGGLADPTGKGVRNYFTHTQALAVSLPAGWRVPTIADFNQLLSNYTSYKYPNGNYYTIPANPPLALTATSGWPNGFQGSNTSGFDAVATGYYVLSGSTPLINMGLAAYYVTADFVLATGTTQAEYGFEIYPQQAGIDSFSPDAQYFALRFVKSL